MGFLDTSFYKAALTKKQENNIYEKLMEPAYEIGSVVLYSYKIQQFIIFPPDIELTNIDRYISIGIILEDLGNMRYIVMFKNVLNHELEKMSWYSKDIPSGVVASFRNYCKRFKKKLSDEQYQIWKNIDFMLPGNTQMDMIYQNQDIIFKKLAELTDEEKADALHHKLKTNNIFCNIGGYVAVWHMPTKLNHKFYSELSYITSGYFLPIFVLDLKNQLGKE